MAAPSSLRVSSVPSTTEDCDRMRLQNLRMQGGLLKACVEGFEERRRLHDQPEAPAAQIVEEVWKGIVNWLKKAPKLFSEFECPPNIEQLSYEELAECAAKVNDLALVEFCKKFGKASLLPAEGPYDQVARDLRERIQKGNLTSKDFKFNTFNSCQVAVPLEVLPLTIFHSLKEPEELGQPAELYFCPSNLCVQTDRVI